MRTMPNRLRSRIEETVEAVVPQGEVLHIRRKASRDPVEMTVDVATPNTDVQDLRQRLLQVISDYYDRPVILRIELHWIQTAESGLKVAP